MYDMRKLLSKIAGKTMSTTSTFSGSLLSTEKAARYVRKLPNKAVVLQEARQVTMGALVRDIDRVFISPGPIYESLHTDKIKWFAKSFYAAGFRKGDVVINTFTYHMSPAGILFH